MELPFQMQTQQEDNWCWAAVSSSVSAFFGGPFGPSGTPWAQCEIANQQLGQTTCCRDGSSAQCDQDSYLDKALVCVQHSGGPAAVGASSFAYIKQEIDAGRPVGVRIGWRGDGGHFVVIRGYDDSAGSQMISVEDPCYGPSSYDLAAFTNAYQSGAGAWSHTYPIS